MTTTRIDETGQQIIIVSGPPDFETLTGERKFVPSPSAAETRSYSTARIQMHVVQRCNGSVNKWSVVMVSDSGLGDHIERTHSTGGLEPPAKKIRIEDGQTYILAVAGVCACVCVCVFELSLLQSFVVRCCCRFESSLRIHSWFRLSIQRRVLHFTDSSLAEHFHTSDDKDFRVCATLP